MYSVKYQKPTNYHQLTEGVRTLQDIQDYLMWQNFLLTRPKLSKNTKPIIVVPGFLADDDSTLIIRGVLKHLGARLGFRHKLWRSSALNYWFSKIDPQGIR